MMSMIPTSSSVTRATATTTSHLKFSLSHSSHPEAGNHGIASDRETLCGGLKIHLGLLFILSLSHNIYGVFPVTTHLSETTSSRD